MTHDHLENNKHKPRGRAACQDPNKVDKAGRTKIFPCTTSGQLDKVKNLVERGANVNHRDNAGWTPLHEAALKGQYEIMKYLIQSGATVNARGFEDDTPLHDASSLGFADCVELLLASGADVYALNTDKKTPIDVCDDNKCTKLLKRKMKELDKLSQKDKSGTTPLHTSCAKGNKQDTIELLSKGANTNARDALNKTPLHCAAESGHLELTQLLVQHGADVNSLDSQNASTLHFACKNAHDTVVGYLIEAGADIYHKDNRGQTPYQIADSPAVRQIITARIDQERKQRAVTEAIDEATFKSNTKQKRIAKTDDSLSREERKIQAIMRAFERVEKKKTKKAASDASSEKTPPVRRKRKSTISSSTTSSRECSADPTPPQKRTVNAAKLDPYKKDMSGRTHLFKWASRGDTHVVETLLKAGAHPNERDNAGYTALHEAALAGKCKVVQLLLDHDADINCKGADLDTPLHDATENGYQDVVKLLLEYGADVHLRNAKGMTALEIAIEIENLDIQNCLKKHKDVKPKKRRLVLAADREQPQSPTSPTEIKTELRDAKAHARQLSGQHLPKKSLKNLHDDRGPHTPIPTPPPEQWHIKQEEEQPSLDCASRFLPLYTIQLVNDTNFYVVDLQLSLLLGISSFKQRYPSLVRRQISPKEKERLWSPLSSMLLDRMMTAEVRELEKSRFLETDIYFVRLDQVVSLVKRDYSHLSASLITIALDIGYSEDSTVKLPPKFAMKMQKCRMLKFNNA